MSPVGRLLLWSGLAALAVAEGHARAFQRLRLQARQRASGLDDVITVLLKMMTEFQEIEKDDKRNWEDWREQADESRSDRNDYIRDQTALIMQSNALLTAKTDFIAQQAEQLGSLQDDVKEQRKSLKEMQEFRQEEHEQHQVALAELTKTAESVNKAIEILEGQYSASGPTLVEIEKGVQWAINLAGVQSRTSVALTTFMQAAGPDWLSVDGSKYSSYEKQGGGKGVVATLKDLRDTINQNKQDVIESENNSMNQYEQTKSAKESELRRLISEIQDRTTSRSKAEATVASAHATIASSQKNVDDGKAYLEKLDEDMAKFTTEFQERGRMRADEMKATQAALDALQAVSAGAKTSVGSFLLQVPPASPRCPRCLQEASRLESLSSSLPSTALAQVAGELRQRAQSQYDDGKFEPVVDLLRQLVERLESEQSGETTQHEWCETERESSESAKDDREKVIKALRSEIERLTISVSQLKGEITFMEEELGRVTKETKAAKSTREEAHEIFTKAKMDHDEVIAAIGKANEALEQKYGLVQASVKPSVAEGMGSLLQDSWLGVPDPWQLQARTIPTSNLLQATNAAEIRDSPFDSYSDQSDNAGSAVEMLQDLLSRYTQARVQIMADEEHAEAAYKELIKTNKSFLVDTLNTKSSKTMERRAKLQQLKDDKEEMKQAFVELHDLAGYLQELRPQCDDIRSTYDERKRRREAEINALKECLDVLSNPSSVDPE